MQHDPRRAAVTRRPSSPLLSRALVTAAALLALGGCASTAPGSAFRDVAQDVEQRSGQKIEWSQAGREEAQIEAAIDRLLRKDLTVDDAVQIALLCNPRLRATFEDLSLGQAELVQAGLLKNPTFAVGATAWEQEHISPNLFVQVEQDFLDLVTMPLRKKVAAIELEATRLRVGDSVLALAAEVREAYYTAQAAEQITAMRDEIAAAAATALELAERQHAAGNINDLALANERGLTSQVRLDLARSTLDVTTARERLTRLLGLWGPRAGYRLAAGLPELPETEVSLERLESLAIERRLDVAAQRREVQAVSATLSAAKTTRWTGFLNVTVEAARLRGDRRISFGPTASLELPIFDQRQAAIARLEALARQSDQRLRALSIDARSEVREARARLVMARTVVEEYRRTLVPLREQIVALSQQQYDAMLLGVYQLLAAKQSEYSAYREYVEALRDYWLARSSLERASGSRLPAAASSTPPAGSPAPAGAPPAGSGTPVPPASGAPAAPPAHHHPPSPGVSP